MKTVYIKKFFLFTGILFLFFLSVNSRSQVIQQWSKRYNNPSNGDDVAVKVVTDNTTGEVYVTGTSLYPGSGYDITTIKYSKEGVQKWLRTYNGTGNDFDRVYDMEIDNNNDIIVTGTSTELNTGCDYVTIKYDSFGNVIWLRKYNGTGNGSDFAYDMKIDNDNAVIITGTSWGIISKTDIVTLKYSSGGSEIWAKRYNCPENNEDEGISLETDALNNVYVTGATNYSYPAGDAITLKYSTNGNLLWTDIYQTQDHDWGCKILLDNNNGQILTVGNSGISTLILCYDLNGKMRWKRAIDSRLEYYTASALDNLGNVYVAGGTLNSVTGYDYIIFSYNHMGELQWSDTYNGLVSGFDKPTAITTDNFNNIYLTGQSRNQNNTSDFATIKYSVSGDRKWVARTGYPRVLYSVPSSISVNNYGDVHITGYFLNSPTTHDFYTVKYEQTAILSKNSAVVPSSYSLSQNYPNPFNPSTQIKFDVPVSGIVKISVYDIIGREVSILADEFKEAGSYELNFDASKLASGTYFYKIQAGTFTAIKKMVLIK